MWINEINVIGSLVRRRGEAGNSPFGNGHFSGIDEIQSDLLAKMTLDQIHCAHSTVRACVGQSNEIIVRQTRPSKCGFVKSRGLKRRHLVVCTRNFDQCNGPYDSVSPGHSVVPCWLRPTTMTLKSGDAALLTGQTATKLLHSLQTFRQSIAHSLGYFVVRHRQSRSPFLSASSRAIRAS